MQEVASARAVADMLERYGFATERGIAETPTAFRAERGHGAPRIAFLSEYDALPGLGHACGHNLIACAGMGAGIGLAAALGDLAGTVVVFGTPAEEAVGGKVIMARHGVFDDIDAAMGAHPGTIEATVPTEPGSGLSLAVSTVEIEFHGKVRARRRRPVQRHQRPQRGDRDLQRHQRPPAAHHAGCAHPRHHHPRRRRAEHRAGVRPRPLLRARRDDAGDGATGREGEAGRGGRGRDDGRAAAMEPPGGAVHGHDYELHARPPHPRALRRSRPAHAAPAPRRSARQHGLGQRLVSRPLGGDGLPDHRRRSFRGTRRRSSRRRTATSATATCSSPPRRWPSPGSIC